MKKSSDIFALKTESITINENNNNSVFSTQSKEDLGIFLIPSKGVPGRPEDVTGYILTASDEYGKLEWTSGGQFGNVDGPSSSTNNAIVRWDNTTGKLIKNSNVTIDDTGSITLQGITIKSSNPTIPYSLTLPPNDGDPNQLLSTNGNGILTWVSNGDVSGPSTSTLNAIVLWDSLTGNSIKNSNLIIDSDRITNVSDPIGLSDVATKNYVDTTTIQSSSQPATDNSLVLYDGTTGKTVKQSNLVVESDRITNVAEPTSLSDAATKNYVDTTTVQSSSQPAVGDSVVLYDGTTGKTIKQSGVSINTNNDINNVRFLNVNGPTSGTLTLRAPDSFGNYTLQLPSDNGTGYLENNGSGILSYRRNEFNSFSDPTSSNNLSSNYKIGSLWVNRSTDTSWMCIESEINTAVWKQISNDSQNNLSATGAPSSGNNLSQGYQAGSFWVDNSSDNVYVCRQSNNVEANWYNITHPYVQNNYSANSAPSGSDNYSQGYSIGSRWIHTTADLVYTMTQGSTTSATWVQTNNARYNMIIQTGGIGGNAALTPSVILDFQGIIASVTNSGTVTSPTQQSYITINFNRSLPSIYTVQACLQSGVIYSPGLDCSAPVVNSLGSSSLEIFIQKDEGLEFTTDVRLHVTIFLT